MAFFRQLRLLLWKNVLRVVRQPLWSLTLISWPLLIFIIIVATRQRFPAVLRDTCYVGPRNLPSTGFLPFLQTIMCNPDSTCHNRSLSSTSSRKSRLQQRAHGSTLAKIFESSNFDKMSFPKDSFQQVATVVDGLKDIIGLSYQRHADKVTRSKNATVASRHRYGDMMAQSANRLKRDFCRTANLTDQNRVTHVLSWYCSHNVTLLEACMMELNEFLSEVMATHPEKVVSVAGAALSVLGELQNHTSLWEGLLAATRLVDDPHVDEVLDTLDVLAVSLQRALGVIEKNIPQSEETLAVIKPLLTIFINVVQYAKSWPGYGVNVRLGDVVMGGGMLDEMVLNKMEISLDKAMVLVYDKGLARAHLCKSHYLVSTLCDAGTVDRVLDMISHKKLIKEVVRLWTEHVSAHDLAFFSEQLHSLMGIESTGGEGGVHGARARRSTGTQAQNIDEELFLHVGQMVLDLAEVVPYVDTVVKSALRTGFRLMNAAISGLDVASETLQGRWSDGGERQDLIDHVTHLLTKVLAGEPVTCEAVVAPLEDLLSQLLNYNMTVRVTGELICNNPMDLLDLLLMDWDHLLAPINNITLEEDDVYDVTLPMILSAWHRLNSSALETFYFLSELVEELSEDGLMSWMPGNGPSVTGNLLQSVMQVLVSSGESLEKSHLWPAAEDYVLMVYGILNYKPGESAPLTKCSFRNQALHCDGDLNWNTLAHTLLQVLTSPSENTLLSLLKGTVNLLENVFGDAVVMLADTQLTQQIPGGDALSDYLLDLVKNLQDFVYSISASSNEATANPHVLLNLTGELFQSSGLAPFFPLLVRESPPSFSEVLEAVAKFLRAKQHLFNFQLEDPTIQELEQLLMNFLSVEGSLEMSISQTIGTSMLTYAFDLDPQEVAGLRECVKLLSNSTSRFILEAVLGATDSLRTVMDAEEGDPTEVVVHYIRQLQEFLMRLSQLRRIEEDPHGRMSQTELSPLVNISRYLSPEGIQMLTHAGPEAAQQVILEVFHKVLPVTIQQRMYTLVQNLCELQSRLSSCKNVTECSAGVVKVFTHLEDFLMMIGSSSFSLKVRGTDLFTEEDEAMARLLISLRLTPKDLVSLDTFEEALDAMKTIGASSNMSSSEILQLLNLTVEELEDLASLLEDVDVNGLLESAMEIPDLLACFTSEQDPDKIGQCVVLTLKQFSVLLAKCPALEDHREAILSAPSLVNRTLAQVMAMNPVSQAAVVNTLHDIVANVKMNLQRNHLYTPEVEREFEVLDELLEVAADPKPLNDFFNADSTDEMYEPKRYLEIIKWYLMKLENASSGSSFSELLRPYLNIVQMNLAQQVAQTDMNIHITREVTHLMEGLRYPLDGEGVHKIGRVALAIAGRLFNVLKDNVNIQAYLDQSSSDGQMFNATMEAVEGVLDVMKLWWQNPNVTMTLANMLQWSNSTETSVPLKDVNQLLQTVQFPLTNEQRGFLMIVRNIIGNLNQVIMVLEGPGDQGMDRLSAPITEVLKNVLQLLSGLTEGPQTLPQQDIMEIVQLSLRLATQKMSFSESVQTWEDILEKGQKLIKNNIPKEASVYLMVPLKVLQTYFEGISEHTGPDTINYLILDVISIVESLLPPNSSAQDVVSQVIGVLGSVLQPQEGSTEGPQSLPQQDIMEIVQLSLRLATQNMSFSESVRIWKAILEKGQKLIKNNIPKEASVYLMVPLKVLLTYFKGISEHTGPDTINYLILDVMTRVESLLPPNSSAQDVVSQVIGVLGSVLQPQEGSTEGPQSLPQQDIMEIVQLSLRLATQNMSFSESVRIWKAILEKGQKLIKNNIPKEASVYLMVPLKVLLTYFKGISEHTGPDTINYLILDVMTRVESLLPPNSSARVVVSQVIGVLGSVLQPQEGNKYGLEDFENLTAENATFFLEHMEAFVKILWPHLGSKVKLPSLADVFRILEDLMKDEVDPETWDELEDALEPTFDSLHETDFWSEASSVVRRVTKVSRHLVDVTKAENDLIHSLQVPVMTLMKDVAHSLNSSHFKMSDFARRSRTAVERTLAASQQADGSLSCSDAVELWEPVAQTLGLSEEDLSEWCRTRLQKVLEAHEESSSVYSPLGPEHLDEKPMNAAEMASTVVEALQSLYHVYMRRSALTQQFITAVGKQISTLAGEPLSPGAEQHLYEELRETLQQHSLSAMKMFVAELTSTTPMFRPYVDAAHAALTHVLRHNQTLSEDVLQGAAMILLSSAGDQTWGEFQADDPETYMALIRAVTKLMTDLGVFEDSPELQEFLESPKTGRMIQEVLAAVSWLTTSDAPGLDLLSQAAPKVTDIMKLLFSSLREVGVDVPCLEPYDLLVENTIGMIRQFVKTSGLLDMMEQKMPDQQMSPGLDHRNLWQEEKPSKKYHRVLMDDFMDLVSIDYAALFEALAVLPTADEITETAHQFFANPHLKMVINGLLRSASWDVSPSQEMTIDSSVAALSYLTCSDKTELSLLQPLMEAAVEVIPEELPFASLVKTVAYVLATEVQEVQKILKTLVEFLQTNKTDPRSKDTWNKMTSQVCRLENQESMQDLMRSYLYMEPGLLCEAVLPLLQVLVDLRSIKSSELAEVVFQTVIGDPGTYEVQMDWTSSISQGLGFNDASELGINTTAPGVITVGELMKNKTLFMKDVDEYIDFHPHALQVLMSTKLPQHNIQVLSWWVELRHCPTRADEEVEEDEKVLMEEFCSMCAEDWYLLTILMARHVNLDKFIFRMVLSEDMQKMVEVMLNVVEMLVNMMDEIMPSVNDLQSYLNSLRDINLAGSQASRRQRREASTPRVTFVSLSRALCRHGIVALLGVPKHSVSYESDPSMSSQRREELIDRFKIPRNATPYCTSMYLDMVNTTGGAIAWAFLKPMLMGEILFTPDTPATRSIMKKSNHTLHEFANLGKHSEEWIASSNYILKSAKLLSQTLPLLQNSLRNTFVKNFIEMQTDVDVGRMKETLSSFSNLTRLLEDNKQVVSQITALSTLMVNISSCITFDRYRGYDSEETLDAVAQDLAKDRRLFGSVIFKLPKDGSSSTLPPKVGYTIRMHMDNVMRTDRTRRSYYSKERHLSSAHSFRYNRGFVYLQENIERAIIESQTGQKVTDPAVQIQPFPYPCLYRDEYLEAISFFFPLLLMLAWILFVADFVRKLVYERELRLHEYMKMMGVNSLSHFFAWFLECSGFLVFTIFILTLVLKYGGILAHSDGFLVFLYLCDYGLSIVAFSFLVSSFFDRNYIAGLSASLLYVVSFFPFIMVMSLESQFTFSQKNLLSIFSPTCFSYASQYVTRYESQGEGIQWSNSYTSPMAGDDGSFGWLCWLMVIDSIIYFTVGAYIRVVFPGSYGIPAPWYFPFQTSFWTGLFCSSPRTEASRGHFVCNILQQDQQVLGGDSGKGNKSEGGDFSHLPVGVALRGLTKVYGNRAAVQDLNLCFYEGHVTSLLGHNGAGKTTTMSLLTGLFAPTSGSIQVYGRDMQRELDVVRRELGVCMQYDVLFDHMTTKEHLLMYAHIKAPHWSKRELREQVRTILQETDMFSHRHKMVATLSGGMKRKLSISIAFIGGSRLVVLDEPTTGVDPCSRRSIWEMVVQHKKNCTIIMSSHHLDEAEVLSDRIALLEQGGLKCCGTPFYLKDQLGHGYKLALTKKVQSLESKPFDDAEMKSFVQAHVPDARLVETQGGDLVYSLPAFSSTTSSSYRSLLTALDANLEALQLSGYGVSDTTLEEVFLQLTEETPEGTSLSISETVSDSGSINSFQDELGNDSSYDDELTGSSTVTGVQLAWQQMSAILTKRFHHSRRDLKGLLTQILLPVLFVVFAMCLGTIKSDLRHFPEMELTPALYNIGPSYTFFRNHNPNSSSLVDTMMSFPGMDNHCLSKSSNPSCSRSSTSWTSSGNISKSFRECRCSNQEQVCDVNDSRPPRTKLPSSQIAFNVTGLDLERYLVATTNDFIRTRYGGFDFGMELPPDLQMDLRAVPKNRTLSKVWFNPEGHHTMPAYLNSLNNFILRSNLPADKDPRDYAISVSSHPYFGRSDDEDSIIQGMLQFLIVMCVLTGYSLTTAGFAIYEVNEHHNGAKRLQHIAGVSEPFYWAVNFLYDMMLYMIPVTVTVAVFAAFQLPAFTDRQNLAAITLLLILFGFATFPWMYLVSGLFKGSEMAFITYVSINLFITVNTVLTTTSVYLMGLIAKKNQEDIMGIFNRLSQGFLVFPQFSFGNGLIHLARMDMQVQLLSGYGIDAYRSPFSSSTFRWMFVSLFVQGLVFFSLRLLLNRTVIRRVRNLVRCKKKLVVNLTDAEEDEDVAAERERVTSGAADSDVLQVNLLSKVYQSFNNRKVHAVKGISVGIPAGECFGLLGENGAGKTTTFKMLTGDVSPSHGTAQVKDQDGTLVDIMACRDMGVNIGYCPQVDALDALLTGEEHLYFYARIRGISKNHIDGVVNYLLKRVGLDHHRDIITDSYSCGTRRKLSTAVALVGRPQILLLDEPSSGMDPRTKRHLWKIISEEVRGKSAVVLTSHSMEECEALCSRLAIMVKGQFRCLGSLQHIKNRFGSGFTVKMYLSEASADVQPITGFMQSRFPSTYLKDQHSSMLEYHVPVAPGGVADIFDQLETNKGALWIKHFSVSQTTLDEVFINFATGNISTTMDDEDDTHLTAVK